MGNIIICGAPRAGTTSLYRYLGSHPLVATSSRKELNYFLGGGYIKNNFEASEHSEREYLSLFDGFNRKDEWTLEASPSYMHPGYASTVAKYICQLIPDARIVMVLRNPSSRLYSQFMGLKERAGQVKENVTFADFVAILLGNGELENIGIDAKIKHLVREGLMVGAYAEVIEKYLRFFLPKNIHIVFTDDLEKCPERSLKAICDWLGISSEIFNKFDYVIENKMVLAKNNQLYRFALTVNHWLEPILNRTPKIRNSLRKVHALLNSTTGRCIESDVGTKILLDRFYLAYNKDLNLLLKQHWPQLEQPDWLNKVL